MTYFQRNSAHKGKVRISSEKVSQRLSETVLRWPLCARLSMVDTFFSKTVGHRGPLVLLHESLSFRTSFKMPLLRMFIPKLSISKRNIKNDYLANSLPFLYLGSIQDSYQKNTPKTLVAFWAFLSINQDFLKEIDWSLLCFFTLLLNGLS